jgi:glycosyltransferase involved in cell wall biosynthesis
MLWIVAPVYNEETNLRAFVADWLPVFQKAAGGDFVFCLVNDGSTDGSLRLLKDLASEHPQLLVINQANQGHGPAILSAYRLAIQSGADWIFQIDSDGQCDPADFEAFWHSRQNGPVHYGIRRGREDGLTRQIISKILTVFLGILTFRWIPDANVPYRLMSREALSEAIKEIPERFRLANVLLSVLHHEMFRIEWHNIQFRRRPGRQVPAKLLFFLRESIALLYSYCGWALGRVRRDPIKGLPRVVRPLLGFYAAYYFLAFVILALVRMVLAVEFDWLESFHLVQVHRILAGQPIYTPPSVEYVPVLYPPLYPYLASAIAFLTGEGYAILRLISFVSALGSQVIIWLLVSGLTGSRAAAWIAAGLYAGTYGAVSFYIDTARIDSLALFFILGMAYLLWLSREKGLFMAILAATAGALAVLTKQTTLAPVAALSLWIFLAGGARGRRTGILCVAMVALSQALAFAFSNGWIFYYLYRMPMTHPVLPERAGTFLLLDFLPHFSMASILLVWAVFALLKSGQDREKAYFLILFTLAMALNSLMPYLKVGGFRNNLIPFAATMVLGSGIAMGLLAKKEGRYSILSLSLLLGFAAQLTYNVKRAVPSEERRQAQELRVELFRNLEEPVFAPTHPYTATAAGKTEFAFWGTIFDVLITTGEASDRLRTQLVSALEQRSFRTVILKKKFFQMNSFPFAELNANYKQIDAPPSMSQSSASGYLIYIPKSDAEKHIKQD